MTPFSFNNHYVTLGDSFYQKIHPEPVTNPSLIKFNVDLADILGLPSHQLDSPEGAAIFSGNVIPDGSEPLAQVYAGHQFGSFNPQLGDGRAILLGEIVGDNGKRYDIQLKGSGRTMYSRSGDGRAALGPVLREYLVSEAMAKLGVPTTRALAVVTTGEEVARDSLLPGGIITRIASSFVRVGTFQYFASLGDVESIRKLADFVIARNYPESLEADHVYVALLQAVVKAQAALIAQWMSFGFIHGVMNTDNMAISGETIDYGPCAFIDHFDHERVYSSIDRHGRYAYNNQPNIGLWNLTRFAETLVPLLADDTDDAIVKAQNVLETYVETYQKSWLTAMRRKCGLTVSRVEERAEEDKALIDELLDIMSTNNADFTLTFYHLSKLFSQSSDNDEELKRMFDDYSQIESWLEKWRQRIANQSETDKERQTLMQSNNPVYIPRNHQIEAAIRAAEDHSDFSVFHALHAVLQNPYEVQEGKEKYMLAPEPNEIVANTFCGT